MFGQHEMEFQQVMEEINNMDSMATGTEIQVLNRRFNQKFQFEINSRQI